MSSSLARFNPFGRLARFEQRHGFDDLLREMRWMPSLRNSDVEPRIKIDVSETEQAYTVKAEIPGVNKDDIQVDVDKNQVTIIAETKRESQSSDGDDVVHSERYFGQQYRSFTLARDIDDAAVVAKYADGILELHLPKRTAPDGKKITIN